MVRLLLILAALLITACSRQQAVAPTPAAVVTPAFQSVDTLVANPALLKTLRGRCKADYQSVGEAQCSAVSEATRRVFLGGGTPYTPHAVAQAGASAVSAPTRGASR